MIAFFIFIFVNFFVSRKLQPYFGKFSFTRNFIAGFFGVTSLLVVMYFLKLDLLGVPASNLDVSKIPAVYIAIGMFIIMGFLLDLLLIYSAKFLNWLHEFLANFLKNRK